MRLHSFGLVALLLTASCADSPPPPDDAGDAQWVMEVIPTLLGRPAKSTLELEALVDIAGAQGREVVADLLMKRPEFARYWAMVLLEDMKLDRGGVNSINYKNNGASYYTPCLVDVEFPASWPAGVFPSLHTYDDPFFEGMTDNEADDILSYVGPNKARTDTSNDANNSFSKLVEAAVHNDRLDLAFAAHMPVLAATHRGQNNKDLRIRFTDRVLNRDLSCIGCHNGEWSITDAPLQVQRHNGGWDRTFPLHQVGGGPELVIEGGLFDYEDASGTLKNGVAGGETVNHNTNGLFGLEQWGSLDNDDKFLNPNTGDVIFGLKKECVTRADGQWGQMSWAQLDLTAQPTGAKFAGLDNQTGMYSVLDVADHFLGISQSLGSGFGFPMHIAERDAYALPASAHPAPACSTCHSVQIDTDGDNILDAWVLDPGFAQIPDWRIEQVLLHDWPTAMDNANCANQANPSNCVKGALHQVRSPSMGNVPYVKHEFDSPQRALGMTVAMQVADHIAEELSGSRMTLEHGMARSVEGADLQRELTYALVDNQWSLRAVLKHVVLSESFNRRAPGEAPGTNHYVLAQVAKPFAQLRPDLVVDPDKDNKASLGDSVHRHSVVHLIEKVHHALGWPSSWAPGRDSDVLVACPAPCTTTFTEFVYPSPGFVHGLGQFKSGHEPGWNEPILPAQLEWEQMMGACAKPAYSVRSPQSQTFGNSDPKDIRPEAWSDWIDILIDAAIAGDWPVEQVLQLTRERLTQDPNFASNEAVHLEVLAHEHEVSLGIMLDLDLDDPFPVMYPFTSGAVDPGDLEDLVRQYCGALVTSPQFMMGGISTANATQAIATGEQLPPRPAFKIPGPIRPGADPQEPLSYSDWCDAYGFRLDLAGLCTEFPTEIDINGEVLSGLLADAGNYLRHHVALEIWMADQRSPVDVGTAIDEVVGANPGVSLDGAADKLEGGQYTSAMTKLGKAAEDLLDAEALGCDCDKALDTLVEGGFIAVEAIITTEKLAGANDRKLADASELLEVARQLQQGGPLVADDPYDREVPLDGFDDRNERPVDPDVPVAVETFALLKEAVQGL